MASAAKIAHSAPETLPADFSEWDGADNRPAQPVKANGIKAVPESAAVRKPSPQPAKPRVEASAVPARLRNTPSLMPATLYADVEDFSQPFRVDRADSRDLSFTFEGESESKNKVILTVVAAGSIVFLLVLGMLIYPRFLSKKSVAEHSFVSQPAAIEEAASTTMQSTTTQSRLTEARVATVAAPVSSQTTAEATQVPVPHVESEMMNKQLNAPVRIPQDMKVVTNKEAPPSPGFGAAGIANLSENGNGSMGSVFGAQAQPKVKVDAPKIVNISAGVAGGLLIQKTAPSYPTVAKTARVSGTVVLEATISKTGTIEDLHVVSGPEILRKAAMDAVRTWRYKPYKLNDIPVEVATTVSVIFNLGG
jgi:protein TonB